jgi:adenylate kinase family enzyme
MFNVCPNCGEYRVDKMIVPEGPYAVCPSCEYQHKFIQLPLFVLTGASGVGKTTTCLALAAKAKDIVVMESDILWQKEFNQPETDYRRYRETWLRVCKNISQAGKPVVLCGTAVPEQFEQCMERRYFSDIHYLALVCEDEVLACRLRSRPAWRGSSGEEYVKEHVSFNRWLKANAATTKPAMLLLDTSAITVDQSIEAVEQWIQNYLGDSQQRSLDNDA